LWGRPGLALAASPTVFNGLLARLAAISSKGWEKSA
jgi:hypothetical protein